MGSEDGDGPIGGFGGDAEMKASILSGPFEDFQVLNDIQNGRLNVIIPAGFNSSLSPQSFSSADSQIVGQIVADSSGFKSVLVSLPVAWILRGVNFPNVSTLPNGEDLSLVADNAAAHTSINLDVQGQSSVHFYFEPPLLGVFVQSPFSFGAMGPFPISLSTSLWKIGEFSTHPHHSPMNGGISLFISLPQ